MALNVEEALAISALCERIGMPWEYCPERDHSDWAWNGETLNLAHDSPNGTSDIVHEIGHWIIAAPERRNASDFGLLEAFPDPELYRSKSDEESSFAQAEEEYASLLGILIERQLKFDWHYTWDFHSWSKSTFEEVKERLRGLQRRGLAEGLIPICLLEPIYELRSQSK